MKFQTRPRLDLLTIAKLLLSITILVASACDRYAPKELGRYEFVAKDKLVLWNGEPALAANTSCEHPLLIKLDGLVESLSTAERSHLQMPADCGYLLAGRQLCADNSIILLSESCLGVFDGFDGRLINIQALPGMQVARSGGVSDTGRVRVGYQDQVIFLNSGGNHIVKLKHSPKLMAWNKSSSLVVIAMSPDLGFQTSPWRIAVIDTNTCSILWECFSQTYNNSYTADCISDLSWSPDDKYIYILQSGALTAIDSNSGRTLAIKRPQINMSFGGASGINMLVDGNNIISIRDGALIESYVLERH